MDCTFNFSDQNNVTSIGIDWSNNKPITLVKRKGNIIVLKIPGGTCWNGIGMPRISVPTRFYVGEVEVIEEKNDQVRLKHLITFAPRNSKY